MLRIGSALALILALSGCGADPGPSAAPEAPKLKPFAFRDMTIGMSLEAAQQSLTRCKDYSADVTACEFVNNRVADLPTLDSWANFHQRKLTSVSFEWPTMHFEAVRTALTQAYGPPCKVDRKVLQNGVGATFSGDEVTWCFAEGEFQLRRYGSNNHTEVIFEGNSTKVPTTYTSKSL